MEHNERIRQMVRLYRQNYNFREIGDQFGVSRERVRQLIGGRVKPRPFLKNWYGNVQVIIDWLGQESDVDVAARFGLDKRPVYNLRRNLGIPAYRKPIGCARCKTAHYARGLCLNCYCRQKRRSVVDEN